MRTEQESRRATGRAAVPPRVPPRVPGRAAATPEERRVRPGAPATGDDRRRKGAQAAGQGGAPAGSVTAPKRDGSRTRTAGRATPGTAGSREAVSREAVSRTATRPAPPGDGRTEVAPAPRRVRRAGAETRPAASARATMARRAFQRPPRAPFVLLVVGLMCGGLVTLLLLNVVLSQDSFRLGDLQSSIDELHEQAAEQENQLRRWTQPDVVDEQARAQGLEEDTTAPKFIDAGAAAAREQAQKEGTDR
ncbi:hypothetical protein [Microbispora sp. H11081]|uniref:hypothetical protein n=1 Tax=Microbispora sp. H11081 TaxID=2729107 RepID=UPI001473D67E|nr:hypothetical protein [Microbispora sp. H11081]